MYFETRPVRIAAKLDVKEIRVRNTESEGRMQSNLLK